MPCGGAALNFNFTFFIIALFYLSTRGLLEEWEWIKGIFTVYTISHHFGAFYFYICAQINLTPVYILFSQLILAVRIKWVTSFDSGEAHFTIRLIWSPSCSEKVKFHGHTLSLDEIILFESESIQIKARHTNGSCKEFVSHAASAVTAFFSCT